MNIIVNEIQGQTINQLSYYETATMVFIGPFKSKKEDSCFNCFIHKLQENESDWYYKVKFNSLSVVWLNTLQEEIRRIDPLSLENTILVIDKNNFKIKRYKIYKNVYCECNIENITSIEEGVFLESHKERVKSVDEIYNIIHKNYSTLIDENIGVGKKMFRDAESNIIPLYAIESKIKDKTYYSYGRSISLKESKISAILEMLERYSSMIPRFEKRYYNSYSALKANRYSIIEPQDYMLGNKFDSEKNIYWIELKKINSNTKYLIPEQCIYFDSQLVSNEDRFIYETSNGTALGGDFTEALVYSILELIERDAFLVHWYLEKLPKKISVQSIHDHNILNLLKILEDFNYEIYIFDISLDIDIPVVWVLARNKDKDAALYIYNAAGSNYYPDKAIFSALVEVATSIFVYEEKLKTEKENNTFLIESPDQVKTMEDHVNYYSFKENSKAFDYLLNNIENLREISLNDLKPKYTFSFFNILEHVNKLHPNIYYKEMNNKLIQDMNLSVVRSFIPSLQPMTFGKQNERINFKRLQQFCKKQNIKIRKEPHPFP
ncbi:YcaO-like family protein [Staphylococcus chromogenes]|uniref:YcaO-like family protein n=1 Tax=Staphylococcus chromogenes TaxID=46126 RepID=UPI0028861D6C|nr:YcaO-like family protein [Staphylococcus chromogenes]MDT0716825.1 YcaO-like family protein [Staphylococcus chromogenes]MDT0736811.1 YcaO-like family protein [Staphylococcus chromogenes]MDT0750889.1 YcaO-like family protein [Staphylococcus chromogenes]